MQWKILTPTIDFSIQVGGQPIAKSIFRLSESNGYCQRRKATMQLQTEVTKSKQETTKKVRTVKNK